MLASGIAPGAWRVVHDAWAYCRTHDGHAIVTEDGGAPVHLRPGDATLRRPGFTRAWEGVETTRQGARRRL